MPGVAEFDVGRAGDGGARIDEVGRVQDAGAVLALIAARAFVATMPACPDDITIGKKASVIDRVNLAGNALFQEPIAIELMIEMLRDLVVLGRMRSAKVIE